MVLLQEASLNSERARLDALRRREDYRTKRFMNAKNRSIGIDKRFLEKQIEEKRQVELALEEEKRKEAENLRQLVQCLDSNEAAAQKARQQSLNDLRQTLNEQSKLPKNNAIKNGPLDLDNCGPSSLQCFSGEDHAHDMRKKAMQDQVKLWSAQDAVEKKHKKDAERREEEQYAAYVLEQDRIRFELEEEARKRRDEEARLRQLENMDIARNKARVKEMENEAEREALRQQSHYLQTCPLLTEDTKLARNANADHRFRPDHFKGYEKDKVSQIYRENDEVCRERQLLRESEARYEADWARYHEEVVDKMREAEELKRRMIEKENRIQRDVLAKQKAELDSRRYEEERERLPEIGTGFFTRFGSSLS